MKKSLLALAILGAFAGAASAQSSVTIYGKVDVSIDSIDNGTDRHMGIDSGNNSASRIGFKGVEDLGNGLKAMFVLENGFNADDGSSKPDLFNRLAYLGLKGGFGTVKLGKQNTQLKDMIGQIDTFGATGMVNGVDFLNGGGLDQRLGNQIAYHTPNFGGFSATVGYVFGEQDNSSDGRGYGARVGYKNGPLNVQFGYQDQNTTNAGGAVDLSGATYDPVAGTITGGEISGPTDSDVRNAMLGATWNFGAFKLHGLYGENKTDNNLNNSSNKIKTGLVGITVPFGASKIRAEYIRNSNDMDNADSSAYAVSYTYDLSKRTQFYTTYLGTKNDDNYNLGYGGPGGATDGENTNSVAVGVVHKF